MLGTREVGEDGAHAFVRSLTCFILSPGPWRHDDKENIVPAFWNLQELGNSFAVWVLGEPEENPLSHGAREDTLTKSACQDQI